MSSVFISETFDRKTLWNLHLYWIKLLISSNELASHALRKKNYIIFCLTVIYLW